MDEPLSTIRNTFPKNLLLELGRQTSPIASNRFLVKSFKVGPGWPPCSHHLRVISPQRLASLHGWLSNLFYIPTMAIASLAWSIVDPTSNLFYGYDGTVDCLHHLSNLASDRHCLVDWNADSLKEASPTLGIGASFECCCHFSTFEDLSSMTRTRFPFLSSMSEVGL